MAAFSFAIVTTLFTTATIALWQLASNTDTVVAPPARVAFQTTVVLQIILLVVMALLAVVMSVRKPWQRSHCITVLVVYEVVVAAFVVIGFHDLFSVVVTSPERACGNCQWKLLLLVAHAGALGGLLHMTSSVAHRVGADNFDRNRALFFLCRPPMGAGLAILVYFVIQTGLLSPTSGGATQEHDRDSIYRILALAGLTGLFARRALDKLAEVFNILFQARRNGGQQSPGTRRGPSQPPFDLPPPPPPGS